MAAVRYVAAAVGAVRSSSGRVLLWRPGRFPRTEPCAPAHSVRGLARATCTGAGNTAGVARLQQVTILQGRKGWKARAGPFQAAWRIISEEYVRRHTVELGDGGLLGNAVQWNRALPLEELGEVLREHGVHTEYLPQGHKPGLHGGRPCSLEAYSGSTTGPRPRTIVLGPRLCS